MKNQRLSSNIFMIISTSLALALQLGSVVARAEKMDARTHTLVIEKLETTLREASEDETLSLRPVRARLADLYAERARLRAMEEAERNCDKCTGALEDRRRALKLYDVVVQEADQEDKGALMIQMAHIHEIIMENSKAEGLYDRIVRDGAGKHSREVLAQGYIGRAEQRFARGEFASAKADFEAAAKLSSASKRGQLYYRIAWCHLNLGDQSKATATLIQILKTPELMTRESTQGNVFDVSFQEDVSRDLGTFVARGEVGDREIRLVESMSPEAAKLGNLKHLASECDRLGNKSAAMKSWGVFLQHGPSKTERLEASVRVTQLRFEMGQREEGLAQMRKTVGYWKEAGCSDEALCKELQARLRKVVVDWNRAEKKAPTAGLLAGYQTYLMQFDRDAEMTYWAALVAREIKRANDAASLYHKSSLLAYERQQEPEMKKILEASLVGYVEMAEQSKQPALREAAYDHYLKLNPQGEINVQVRYQRAHVAYERGDAKEASSRLHEFAVADFCKGSKASELCVKAADLDLDALALAKDDASIESRALEYAPLYPARRAEYLKLSRTSVLKQATGMEAAAALRKVSSANMAGAPDEERERFLKTRLSLAEKAQDLDETRLAAEGLLKIRSLSEADREMALSRLAWVAEMRLDFAQAYAISRKMRMPKLSAEEREMRLALLAELSGRSPRAHEEEFLRLSRSASRRALVRAKLVRSSAHPSAEIRKHEAELKRFPSIHAPLALEIYAKTGSRSFAEQSLKTRGVSGEPAGRMLQRQLFLRDFAKLDAKIAAQKIRSQSDSLTKKTLADRLSLIAEVEAAASQAIAMRDTTLQLIVLSVVARENMRTYEDIRALPVPRQLKGQARETYLKLVEKQAMVYRDKHDKIEKKLEVIWNDSKYFDALAEDYAKMNPSLKSLQAFEFKKLAAVAPSSVRRTLENAMSGGEALPSQNAIASARREVSESPFSEGPISTLKKLEAARGREVMVTYLDARLLKLKEGVRK